jgi:hypothetical protein
MQQGLGEVAHTYNPSYWRGRDRERSTVQDQGQKASKISSQPTNGAWWCIPMVPARRGKNRKFVVQAPIDKE